MSEFDLVAPYYDSTRKPPSEEDLDAVAQALHGAKEVLEGGVGTGRYALPLLRRGFRMTGVDISREMLRRSREKGLDRVLLGDLHRLPFPDGRFDAGLLIHVLQLLPEPTEVLGELARVSRSRVVAQLPDFRAGGISLRGELRERYAELAREMGHPLPDRRRYWENSERVLQQLPPDQVLEVREDITPDPDPERRWRDLRTFGGLITVPEEVHERIVARLRAEHVQAQAPEGPRTRALRIASWEAPRLRTRLAALPPTTERSPTTEGPESRRVVDAQPVSRR